MNDPQDDKLIKLYRHSRQEKPSVSIDNTIRHAAQQALYRKRKRWLWGLSTAAVIVISFNVVLQLMLEETAVDEVILRQDEKSSRTPSITSLPIIESEGVAPSEAADFSNASDLDQATENLVEASPSPDPQKATPESAGIDFYEELKERQFEAPEIKIERKETTAKADLIHKKVMGEKKRAALLSLPTIPALPHSLDEILSINNSLIGEQTVGGLITIYSGDKLILTVNPGADLIQYKAWPGSGIVGIRMNWFIKPGQTDGCIEGPVYQVCDLNEQVKGLFEGERLDHILWNKPNG